MRWVRANEPAARAYMAGQLFLGWREDWYDEEIDDVTPPEEFHSRLAPSGINFYDDQEARLIYDDGELFGATDSAYRSTRPASSRSTRPASSSRGRTYSGSQQRPAEPDDAAGGISDFQGSSSLTPRRPVSRVVRQE
ncbi:hypothetical protein PX52LOC_08047 [Limnoglobus roseus]|uniref:Uncharacterized protein n=1 Tax=Limnoglobus roseus TaxID=2598579 RepID=A0A5C1AS56_9BACT|nr:hypothetical protein PX52LOC_08047 [Limnoglobus roseus]